MFDKKSRTARLAVGLAGLAIVVGACGGGGSDKYSIGYSNGGGVGNGFREEQVCTAKAEALSSGKVETLTTIHRNTDAAGQLADIRDLIAKGVKAIVFNPNDPEALNPALEEAKAAGIVTVSVDATVTHPDTYNLTNNQVDYAYLGAKWLFEKLGGKGNVYYMRGFAGHPADTDRHTGFQKALAEYPDIVVLPTIEGEHTQWDSAKATELMNNWIASGKYDETDGIWTSGMDQEIVDAIKAAGKEFVPVVGADRGGFVNPLLDETGFAGLEGAAVTNTAAVGGAGISLALKLLNREDVETSWRRSSHRASHAGRRIRRQRCGPQDPGILARRRPRSDVAAGPHDRGLDDLHPRAGHRLQGPGRGVVAPRS